MRRRTLCWIGLVVAVLWCCGATAQEPGGGAPRTTAGALALAPREALQRLAHARQFLDAQRYAEAVAALDKLQRGAAEDGFLPSAETYGVAETVRGTARRLLGTLPEPGRQAYQLQFEALAQSRLEEAARGRSRAALERLCGDYFHTDAGAQAALLLAYHDLSRGRPWDSLQRLRWFEQSPAALARGGPEGALLSAACWVSVGSPAQARDALRQLAARWPDAQLHVGDRVFAAGRDQAAALAHLTRLLGTDSRAEIPPPQDWTLFRGDAARNAQGDWSGPPGPLQWKLQIVEKPEDVDALLKFQASRPATLPVLFPLVVGNTALVRTPQRLTAVDVASGRQMWEYPWGPYSDAVEPSAQPIFGPGQHGTGPEMRLQQRSLEDAAYGQISSDGRRVFLLDKLDFCREVRQPAMSPRGTMVIAPVVYWPYAGRQGKPNRLVALDLRREGSIAWSIGGTEGEDEPCLSGATFLGAPLVDDGRLYVVVELQGEVRLCVLGAESGRLEWSQRLAQPPALISWDPTRRLAASSPSLGEGVLVCPTSAGVVAAVEPATRSLRWGFTYPRFQVMRFGTAHGIALPDQGRWLDATPIIAEGRVLITPVDSDQCFCLDLSDGHEIWSLGREEAWFIACVHEKKVVFVGRHEITAVGLDNRKPVWKPSRIALPGDTAPSGRGLYARGRYWLPTTGKQLLEINLDDGRITAHPTDELLGNLVSVRGRLIVQSLDAVRQFAPAAAR